MKTNLLAALLLSIAPAALAAALETKPNDPYYEKFQPRKAPQPPKLLLQKGDRLAIIGDSITEQKMYSRIMETYLTVCAPELEVSVRQYGWGGETAPGFLSRMTNDCLRFKPTIATTCYGMNDHGYGPYRPDIGDRYRKASTAIVQSFKANGVRVIQGSPGCVSKKAEALNLNLCELRNIGIEIAESEMVGFADVFWPMFTAGHDAHLKYSPTYAIAGGDGVHPGGAGHLVMAYAFLKALGLHGEIGRVDVNLDTGAATSIPGHQIVSFKGGVVEIKSARYPFCAEGPANTDGSLRSGMTLVPFNSTLNRFLLVASGGKAASYKVTWGAETKTYSAAQLSKGVNLADDFAVNPFSEAFKKVDAAVAAKQGYETHQIKNVFHGAEFKFEPETMLSLTERIRAPLVTAIKTAFVPVTHTIKIVAE